MIAVAELGRIAEARIADAKVLLAAGRYDGATYLCGYAVVGTAQQVDTETMVQAAERLLSVL